MREGAAVEVKLHLQQESVSDYGRIFSNKRQRPLLSDCATGVAILLGWLVFPVSVLSLGPSTFLGSSVLLGLAWFVVVSSWVVSIRDFLGRHQAARETKGESDSLCTLRISPEGVTTEYRHSRHSYRWLAISGVARTSNAVYLRLDADHLLRIPSTAFTSEQEFQAFADQCRRYYDEGENRWNDPLPSNCLVGVQTTTIREPASQPARDEILHGPSAS